MATGSEVRVAIDATPLLGVRTGIGRSVQEIVTALGRLDAPPALIPYVLGLRSPMYRKQAPSGTRWVTLPTRALLSAWSRGGRPRLDWWLRGADVVHATNFVVPPSRLPTVVTVNDISFAHAGTTDPVVRSFGPVLRGAVARGVTVHVTTEHVAGEVEELFGPGLRNSGRLAVVPFGFPDLGPPAALTDRLEPLAGTSYVLALGRLEARKNIDALVRAFGAVAGRHPHVRLVVAGPDGPGRPAVDAALAALPAPCRARVVMAGLVTDEERRALLGEATVLAYPSLYEGFGFPVLEAMALGVPVMAAAVGAVAEVAGDAALLVDVRDGDALADGLDRLLGDPECRARLAEAGRRRAGQFSWSKTAAGLSEVYRRLAG